MYLVNKIFTSETISTLWDKEKESKRFSGQQFFYNKKTHFKIVSLFF